MISSTIEMSQKIRVKINPSYKGIYNALKNYAVGDFHELFFLCVCIGHKKQKCTPLGKREDCFWSNTILPDEWYAYYALFVYDNGIDLALLGDDEKVISIMQEYANGGMEILIEDFLCDYVKKDPSGHYIVDHVDQLPKELLFKTMDWGE